MEELPTWLRAFNYIRDEPSLSPIWRQDRYEDDAVSETFLGVSTAVEQAGTASTTTTPEHGSQAQYDTALQHNDTCTKAQLEHGAAWGSEEAGGFYVDLGPKYRAKRALSEDGRAEASPAARPNPTRTANVFVKLPEDYAEEEAQERARKHQQAQKQLPAHRPAQEQEQQQEQEHHEYQYQHQHQHQNQNQHHHHHHLQYQQTLFTGDPMDWDPIVEGATTPDEAREWPGPDEDHYAVDACGRCASWVEVTGQLAARMQEQDVSSKAQWERIWQLERLVWAGLGAEFSVAGATGGVGGGLPVDRVAAVDVWDQYRTVTNCL